MDILMEACATTTTGKRLRPADSADRQDQAVPDTVGPPSKRRDLEPEKPNHVLLMTIVNPAQPITVEVLRSICSVHGQVLRIVIFKKNGVQAMVEFDSAEAAARVKRTLSGQHIYAGCCMLRIEFAKPTRLNVYKNDAESWDYTAPTSLGQEALYAAAPVTDSVSMAMAQLSALVPVPPLALAVAPQLAGALGAPVALPAAPVPAPAPLPPPAATPGPHGAVLMVYGLNGDVMNADRLFNLFCLYGNVIRVKFLKTKQGCAMVQLGDALAVHRAIGNLSNLCIFGNKLQLGYSKQAFLNTVQQPYTLPDGSPSFRDFTGCKNNRFLNAGMASKNRLQAPTKVLHFFNAPPQLSGEELSHLFTAAGAAAPSSTNVFPSKTERSSSGLAEFSSTEQAVEALVLANHQPISRPTSKFPFTVKLCFSSSRAGGGVIAKLEPEDRAPSPP